MAQLDSLRFKKYGMAEGLSDNVCTSIIQDEEGYIWIGSTNGLNRFNGSTFNAYHQQQTPVNLPGNYIRAISKFKDNTLGFITRKGVTLFNTKTYTETSLIIEDSTAFSVNINASFDLVSLQQDKYFAFSSRTGFYVFDRDGNLYFRYDHFKEAVPGRRLDYAQDIFKLNENEVLIYTDNNLAYFNLAKKSFRPLKRNDANFAPFFPERDNWTIRKQLNANEYIFLPFTKDSIFYYNRNTHKKTASPLPFNTAKELYWASYIFEINDSTFAINCTYGGVFTGILNRRTGSISFKPGKELTKHRCNWIFKDCENRLWVATDNGILKQEINAKPIKSWMIYGKGNTSGSAYFSNTLLKDGKIFLTRYTRSEGLYILDADTKELIKKISFYGSNEEWNSVISIQMYYKDTLWISSIPGILWLDLKTYRYGKLKLPSELDRRILEMGEPGPDGKAWMCGVLNNRAVCYDLKKRTFTFFTKNTLPAFKFTRPKQTVRDYEGNIWFAGHGLQRYDTKKNSFDSLMDHYHGLNKHEDNILHISPDRKGNLWLHAVENGLQRFNIKENRFTSFTFNDGLPSNIIQSLSPVIKDYIWMGFMGKLVRFNTITGDVLELTTEDGLPDQNYTDGRMFYDSLGKTMYVAMNNYLVAFDADLKPARKNTVPFLVDEIHLGNNELIRSRDSISLGWQQSKLLFKLTTIDFDHESPYVYSYQVDQEDTLLLNGSELSLNLDPGKHNLNLWAKDRYGKRLNKQVFIIVEPPFWRKWWFVSLSVLAIVCAIYLFIQFRLNRIRKRTELNLRLSEFELKALHAQMNPHFIFNCLNSIKALILYNRNTEATQYLNKFSSLVRQNLDHSRKQFLTLKQNIEYLNQYIEIESLRFIDFKFSIETEATLETDDIKIAPMLLQPLIENAIWHGLQQVSGEKILNLRFSEKNQKVVCEIEDNGIGIIKSLADKKEGHTSIGIENIRQRITLLNQKYNLNYKLEITDRSQNGAKGTLVVLSFDYL